MAILVAMLASSFFGMFVVMAKMDNTLLPGKLSVWWVALLSVSILFPVMASHIHSIGFAKRIGWLTWWFIIVDIWIGALWIYTTFRDPEANRFETDVVTWFSNAVVGGTLGGFVVFGLARRFAPSWLGCQELEVGSFKPKLGLKTLFFWLTSVGLICGVLVNAESWLLVVENDIPLVVWLSAGPLYVGVFCLLVFFSVTAWLRNARPFWMAVLTLVVLSPLVAGGLASWVTIAETLYDSESSWNSIAFTILLPSASLYAALWILGCQWAGLIKEPGTQIAPERVLGRWANGFSAIRRWGKRVCFAMTALVFVYIAGWCFVHFSGGARRDPRLLLSSINQSLGSSNPDVDWIEIINRQWGEGVSKEDNLAVQLLGVMSSLPKTRSIDPNVDRYFLALGLSEIEIAALPVFDIDEWFRERHEEYRQQLLEAYPEFDDRTTKSVEQMMKLVEKRKAGLSHSVNPEIVQTKERQLAEFFFRQEALDRESLTAAPWSRQDYPVGAELIESLQPQIIKLRELSRRSQFYSPLVRDEDGEVLQLSGPLIEDAWFVLTASAYHGIGNGEIDKAIEDCEALWRLASLPLSQQDNINTGLYTQYSLFRQDAANRIAEAIVFSNDASLHQMQRLFAKRVNQSDILLQLVVSKGYFTGDSKDDLYRRLFQPIRSSSYKSDASICRLYRTYPGLVDWATFNSEIDRRLNLEIEAVELAVTNEIDFDEYSRRISDIWFVRHPSGWKLERADFYSVFGRQLAAFVKGPEEKGRVLAEVYAKNSFVIDVFLDKANRRMGEIAMAIEIYERISGRYPDSLEQLVPDLFHELKMDPYSGDPFIYRPGKGQFLLYSVFLNQQDDGGSDGPRADFVYNRPCRDLIDYLDRDESW